MLLHENDAIYIQCVTNKKKFLSFERFPSIRMVGDHWNNPSCADVSYHVRKGFFGHLKFQLFAISSLFFNLWWFHENSWNSHSLLILSRRALEIFSDFFIYIYTQKWSSKGQKTWFKNPSLKTRDSGRPEGRGCSLEFCWVLESYSMQLVRFQTRSLARASKSN